MTGATLALAVAMLLQAAPSVPPRGRLARLMLEAPVETVQLPSVLRELSGLAVLPDRRWLAHNDEAGIIYQRHPATGRWSTFLQFDGDEARGDFEAITLAAGRVWLQTSDGRRRGRMLVRPARPAPDVRSDDRAPCEVEALLPGRDAWWAPCKRTGRAGGLLVLRQPMAGGKWTTGWRMTAKELARHGLPRVLGVSDGLVDPETGHWLLVAGPERWLLEVTPAGTFVAAHALARRRHPQPEALALLQDGSLLIGDEGARTGTISRYAARR